MRIGVSRSRFGRTAIPIIAAAMLSVGCDGSDEELALSVGAGATFQTQAGPPRAVGYQLAVVILQVQTNARPTCPALPSTLHLLVNDQEVQPVFDPSTGCLNTGVTFDLTPQIDTVTVDAKNGEQPVAHAEFQGLAPGGGATLAVPADGQVHAGDEIVVVPTSELPTGGRPQQPSRRSTTRRSPLSSTRRNHRCARPTASTCSSPRSAGAPRSRSWGCPTFRNRPTRAQASTSAPRTRTRRWGRCS